MFLAMSDILDYVQIATFTILAITAIASTIKFFDSRNKTREVETFENVDAKFNEFLQICLDKPYLDIFDVKDEVKTQLNKDQIKEEKIAFAYLISVFERVYIFYYEHGKGCDQDQRDNWTKTIQEYMSRDNFRKAWRENSSGWDGDFIYFMNDLYLRARNKVILKSFNDKDNLDTWYELYKHNFEEDENNDTQDGLLNYLKEPYKYYFIQDDSGQNIGGILTQDFKRPKATVVLYFFIIDEYKNKGYGSYAMLTLRNYIPKQKFILAEIEKRNKKISKLKDWYMDNLFYELNFDYYTPIIESDKEIDSRHNNFLFMNNIGIVHSSAIYRIIRKYHKTSFAHNKLRLPKTNLKNRKNIKNMGKTCNYK